VSNEFKGVGWRFPVASSPDNNGIQMSKYEDDIREAILIILNTAKGERIMHPDFGCGIHDMVFQTLGMSNLSLIELAIREALTKYEPRIELTKVSIDTEEARNGKLLIGIDYTVRSTNNRFNLVYPFYLTEGA
jgi:uncharacterized protein